MKGILKIYHPDETLKYHISNTYCKAVYLNEKYFLEVEIRTNDDLDHVDDDSLQYNFPQLSLDVFDFPIEDPELAGQTFQIDETEGDSYTEVDLFDDVEAQLAENQLSFKTDEDGELQLMWQGKINDFYTSSGEMIPFKLKCSLKQEEIEVEE